MSVFGIPIFPEQASSFAMDVDVLYFFVLAVSAFFALLVAVLVVIFGIKFHRKRAGEVGARIEGNLPMELMWSVIPTIIAMVMFGWGASVYYHLRRPPDEAMHIYAVGKQWMWKFQHLEGQREINELHVPTGRPIKVTVTSEDVLHSLYFPAFRTKIDAIPGRYMELWFEATKPGTYHIFCAEYCGTNHSGMIGSVVVMEPAAYQSWLAGGGEGSLADRGGSLFQQMACNTCHLESGQGRGPSLQNIWGKPVELSDGSTVVVDEAYVRESILNSQAKVVRGFQPLMPTFQGLISEEGLVSLIEYVRSLSPSASSAPAAATPSPGVPGDESKTGPTGGRTPQEAIERAKPGTTKPGSDR
jgi:cytochrome c oxidase subunit II